MLRSHFYTIPNHTRVSTLRDGNCLFNTLALAVRDFLLGNVKLDAHAKFDIVNKFNQLHQTHFSLQEFIHYLSAKNNTEVQRELSPVLRELACELRGEEEQQALDTSDEPNSLAYTLFGYFDEMLKSKFGLPNKNQRDDIFSSHPATRDALAAEAERIYQHYQRAAELEILTEGGRMEKFMHRYNWYLDMKTREKYQQDLEVHSKEPHVGQNDEGKTEIYKSKNRIFSWWKNHDNENSKSGCQQFLDSMKSNHKWGGDIEASALARRAKFNLTIHTPAYIYKAVDDQHNAPTVTLQNSGTHWTYYQPAVLKKVCDFFGMKIQRNALFQEIEATPDAGSAESELKNRDMIANANQLSANVECVEKAIDHFFFKPVTMQQEQKSISPENDTDIKSRKLAVRHN